MLQDHQLDEDVKKTLAITFYVNTAIDKSADNKNINKIADVIKKNKEIINIKEFSNEFSDHFFSTPSQQSILVPIRDGESKINKTKGKSLKELFDKAYKNNEMVKEIINMKACGL